MKTLNLSLKRQLLSHSAKALKVCTIALDVSLISSKNLHEMAGRASPDKLMDYKLALQLYKTFNSAIPVQDWINVNLLNINTSRQHFSINKSNRLKMGMNSISQRFYYLNGKIELNWRNLSFDSYKVKCKKLFL